jgi:RNA polymerase sigma factor (sigma-70 family)
MAMQNSSLCANTHPQLGLAEHTSHSLVTFHDLFGRLKRFVDQAAYKYHGLNKRLHIDDLKQTGYIALWKAHQSYNTEQGFPIEHYARRAVVNEILKECQRGQTNQVMLYHDCVFGDDSTDRDDASVIERLNDTEIETIDPIFKIYAGQEVSLAIFGQDVPLTDPQRQLLDLHYRQGHSMQETADLLGVTQQNVSKQHRKAIDVCRTYLGVTVH